MTRTLRRAAVALAVVSAAGCSATSVPIYGSDGRPYVYVDCSGMFSTLDECYRLASEVCPGGYRIANGVAPRESPFGNLVVDCGAASDTDGVPPPPAPTPPGASS